MRTLAVARRILSQFRHDKRTLALLFVAPLIVLWLLSILLGADAYQPNIATVDLPDAYQSALETQNVHLTDTDKDEAERLLEHDDVDAVLSITEDGVLDIHLEGSDSTKNAAVIQTASQALADLREDATAAMNESLAAKGIAVDASQAMPVSDVETSYLHGDGDRRMFDNYGPVFIGIFLFAFTFLTAGMSLVNERTAGTMQRFLATPIRPVEILGGYLIGFGALACVQVAVILFVALRFIGFPNEGDLALVILMAVSMTMVSVTLGLLVSGLARNAFQVIQLILLFVVPQILLSGLFDLSGAPAWMRLLGKCMPVTYGVDALRDVMLRGRGFADIWPDFAVVWAFVAVLFALAAMGFRKKRARRPAPAPAR